MSNGQPRYAKAYTLANDLLIESDINFFTTPIASILYSYNIRTIPFSRLTTNTDSPLFKSAGFSCIFDRYDYVLYDDRNHPYRIRFTHAHELGHIFFDHKNSYGEYSYDTQENEANHFAAQLLMPIEAIFTLESWYYLDESLLIDYFHVSYEAAKNRLDYFQRNRGILLQNINNELIKLFGNIIRKDMHPKMNRNSILLREYV